MFLFLVNLKETELEIGQGVKLLKEAYSEDVYPKLTDELLHFCLYVRQIQSQGLTKEQSISLSYENLYQIMCKKKFTQPFLM